MTRKCHHCIFRASTTSAGARCVLIFTVRRCLLLCSHVIVWGGKGGKMGEYVSTIFVLRFVSLRCNTLPNSEVPFIQHAAWCYTSHLNMLDNPTYLRYQRGSLLKWLYRFCCNQSFPHLTWVAEGLKTNRKRRVVRQICWTLFNLCSIKYVEV